MVNGSFSLYIFFPVSSSLLEKKRTIFPISPPDQGAEASGADGLREKAENVFNRVQNLLKALKKNLSESFSGYSVLFSKQPLFWACASCQNALLYTFLFRCFP